MECSIITKGLLNNENGPKSNPWELHTFKHKVKYTTTKYYKNSISWYLTGNIPKDIIIENKNSDVIIYGNVTRLDQQPSLSKFIVPFRKIDIGGDGSMSGRIRGSVFDFIFSINHKYNTYLVKKYIDKNTKMEYDPYLTDKSFIDSYLLNFDQYLLGLEDRLKIYDIVFEEEMITSEVSIKVIRNNSLDENLYFDNYLMSDFSMVNGIKVKHSLWKNGKKYTIDNIEDYRKGI